MHKSKFYTPVGLELDQSASRLMEWVGGGKSHVVVVSSEFSHVPPLPKRHPRSHMFACHREGVVQLPREVGCIVLDRARGDDGSRVWQVSGVFRLNCRLPDMEYCAHVHSSTCTVTSATAQKLVQEVEAAGIDPLRYRVPNSDGMTLLEVLRDPATVTVSRQQAGTCLLERALETAKDAVDDLMRGSPLHRLATEAIASVRESFARGDEQRVRDDVDWLLAALNKCKFNVQHDGCSNRPKLQRIRANGLRMYESDPMVVARMDDADHSGVRWLVDDVAGRHSHVVCKSLFFLDALRNHAVKYALPQPAAGISLLDVAAWNQTSREVFGSAKLDVTASRIPASPFDAALREAISPHLTLSLHKAANILHVAMHIASCLVPASLAKEPAAEAECMEVDKSWADQVAEEDLVNSCSDCA